MQQRYMGKTGLKVSELCLGAMTFGRETNEADSFAIMDRFAAAGGNFIDTADVYTRGASEEIVGRWLRTQQRDDFATGHGERHVPHRHDLRVAAAVDLREAEDFDRGRVRGGCVHHDRTLLGSTRIAVQMPSRLEATEIATTTSASPHRSSGAMSTRRGNFGNTCCPIAYAMP